MTHKLLAACSLVCLAGGPQLSGCAGPVAPDNSGSKADEAGGGANASLEILPIVVDAATRSWAASEPSAVDGSPIGDGRRFREGLARIVDELAAQGAPSLVMAYGFPADPGEQTRQLGDALDRYGAPVVLMADPDADPRLYARRLVGHGSALPVLVAEQVDADVRIVARGFGYPLQREGRESLSTLGVAAHLEQAGMDPEQARSTAAAAARCVAEEIPLGYRVEAGKAEPTGHDTAVVLERRSTLAPVSALAILHRQVVVPSGAIAVVSEDVPFDLLGDGVELPPAIGHAWAMASVASGCR